MLSTRAVQGYKKQTGLTLVELMVVVAVMAILASVVMPLYTDQVRKGRRADAKIALEAVALAQERYFSVNGGYAASLSSLGLSADLEGGESEQGYYGLTLDGLGADSGSFTITAARSASGAQSGDTDCDEFSLTHQGVKAAEKEDGSDHTEYCW